ncbi:thaumatin-like protein [Musa troglodytarum]|uniref:Thaumatin-like protein n=1 Tax=Musa troglodytarum TaxID=320322 RepID=A0A9E7K3B3_9LILI|nr:thaumatin-like protein [Musa troglodytarum]
MEPSLLSSPAPVLLLTVHLLFFLFHGGEGTTFTFVNRCGETVWPGILSNAGTPQLESTGFELPVASSRSFQAPTGWSGRFWARTGCSSTGGTWSCATGDCGSGQVECNGAGAAPPATLAEFTLAPSSAGQDFYDVSLVDGYNLPMVVEASGGAGASGECAATGCVVDLNRMCPPELRAAQGVACRSACEAFGTPEYCCSGAFASPATCRPSSYSQMFKAACPRSYSYAFDDPTSTFTCAGAADYTITFCPRSAPSSQKASRDSSTSSTSTPKATGGLTMDDDSWLASLATGDATAARRAVPRLHQSLLLVATTVACTLLLQSYNINA